MPSYKLIYFDGRGRAEVARFLFALSGTAYEDKRLTREQWGEFKPSTRFGQMPLLEIDGKQYAQSGAINNYLAREFGYLGKNNIETLEIDQVNGLVGDYGTNLVKVLFPSETDNKEEVKKKFLEETIPKFFGLFEKLLEQNGSTGYLVGSSITLADVCVFRVIEETELVQAGISSTYPLLQKLKSIVESNENIKKYLANRKATPF